MKLAIANIAKSSIAAIGVLIAFLGGLMAIDLVPRKATGVAIGIKNVVTGLLLDNNVTINADDVSVHDFTYVSSIPHTKLFARLFANATISVS